MNKGEYRSSFRNRIIGAFLIVVIAWGTLLSVVYHYTLNSILAENNLSVEVLNAIGRRFAVLGSSLTLVGIALFLLVAVFLAKAISRPIREFTDAVSEVSRGNLNVKIETGTNDELSDLAGYFNEMTASIKQSRETLESEVKKRTDELKAAQSRILQQDKMASIGQLAAGVAHEINNPVGFIMSNLGTLPKYADKLDEFVRAVDDACAALPPERLAELDEKRKRLKINRIIEDIRSLAGESTEGAQRIRKIVQDLKTFSRLDESDDKPADINAGIESTLNIVWNEIKYKAVLTKEYGEIPMTRCNPGQINQVFMNLLVNAAHAIETQGEIEIRTRAENENIFVSISDTGHGIPEENIGRIFDPFYTTKEVGKGTGLGLSIAYDIVKRHGGDITVDSKVGMGTTFTVRLPVVS